MNKRESEITYIPYQQKDEPPRRAAIVQVEFSLDNWTDDDIQLLGHLSDAVDLMNPVYRDQYEPKTPIVERVIGQLNSVASPEQKAILRNYQILLHLQNSPYSLLPRKNNLLGLPENEIKALAKKAGESCAADLDKVASFFFEGLTVPDKAGYYPADMTEDDWTKLGDDANIVNAMARRTNGKIAMQLNEVHYKESLQPIIACLDKAREHCRFPEFRIYLDGKIEELRHGTRESRRIADFLWIRHKAPIDLILSTALEVYLDNWKNARGEAAGAVYVENAEAQTLLRSLVDRLPHLEATAPWTHRKTNTDPATLPHLRFVDVLNWSGDYVNSPMTIIAQSLPNDDWVISNLGSVNLVYRNTGKAVHSLSGDLMAEEFMSRAAFEEYRDVMFEASQVHSALHELGHTTGAMDSDHRTKQARDYLEAEFSPLEEARAELFGMFAMTRVAKDGIISGQMAAAGHYSMLVSMVQGLRFKPEQAHVKARNLMYHFFASKGGIKEVQEDGKRKFQINLEVIDDNVEELLGEIGNIKAAGDKSKAAALRERYCSEDPLREEIEKRTQNFPLGRGLIFPQIKRDGDHFVRQLEYPPSFTDQPKFKARLIS